jgi:hypothetical protein
MAARRWTTAEIEDLARRRKARIEAEDAFAAELDSAAATLKPVPERIAGRIYPLVLLCRDAKLPEPVPEWQFHPARGWRLDYAWPYQMVGVEIDGGVWTGGRHTRGAGFIEDQRKLNAATLLGWRVLRYTPDRLGEAIADLKLLLR